MKMGNVLCNERECCGIMINNKLIDRKLCSSCRVCIVESNENKYCTDCYYMITNDNKPYEYSFHLDDSDFR